MAIPGFPGDGGSITMREVWEEIYGTTHSGQSVSLGDLFQAATGQFYSGYDNGQPWYLGKFRGYSHATMVYVDVCGTNSSGGYADGSVQIRDGYFANTALTITLNVYDDLGCATLVSANINQNQNSGPWSAALNCSQSYSYTEVVSIDYNTSSAGGHQYVTGVDLGLC